MRCCDAISGWRHHAASQTLHEDRLPTLSWGMCLDCILALAVSLALSLPLSHAACALTPAALLVDVWTDEVAVHPGAAAVERHIHPDDAVAAANDEEHQYDLLKLFNT